MSGPGTPTRIYRSEVTPTPPPPPPKSSVPHDSTRSLTASPFPGHQSSQTPQPTDDAIYGLTVPLVARPEPGWLPEALQDKSIQDLRHLLENPDLQSAILDNPVTAHPSIAASQEPLKHLLQNNLELATAVQELEERLVSQRSFTQSHLLALRALEQQHRSKIAETENALQNFSPTVLYRRLNAGAQEQDNLLKTTEESFLEQDGVASEQEVNAFLRRVREIKRTAFLRDERKKRWDEGRVGGWR